MSEHDDHIPPSPGDRPPDDAGRSEGPPPTGDGGGAVEGDGDDAEPKRSVLHRVLRTVAISLASIIALVATMLLLFVLALQTNWGGTHFADFLLTLGNPFSEAQTEYDELRGNFVSRFEMRDLRLYRLDTVYVDTLRTEPRSVRHVRKDSVQSVAEYALFDSSYIDTLHMAAIDTFRMRYNLLGLFAGRIDLREVYFANPVLRARQRPDSTWDLLEPFGRDDTVTTEPLFTLHLGELKVTEGNLFAMYFPPQADSVLQVENFNARASDFVIGSTATGRVDTLFARYMPPGSGYWTELHAGGSIDERMLDVAGLHIESPYSYVTAEGTLQLPDEEHEEIRDVDFNLRADPLAFRDITLFFPSLNPDRTATLDLQVGGSTREMNIDGSANLSDGGSLSVTGHVAPQQDGPLEYVFDADVQNFNPAFFTTPPGVEARTVLTGSINVDLEGTDEETLSGSAAATLVESTVIGLELSEAVVNTTVDAGRFDFDLRTNWRGSTITSEGTLRPFRDVPSYDATGRTQNFNIASIAGPEHQSDLDATFAVEGRGFEMATADLEATLNISRSTVNNYQIDDGRVELTMVSGELSYGFRFLFPDGLLVANGDASFDDPVTYRVGRGRFENVDLAALLGQDVRSSLNGAFTLNGTGSDPQTLTAEAALDMEPSTYGNYQLQTGRIALDLQNGRLEMIARAQLQDAGLFDFAAYTRPFDDVPTFHVTRGEFTDVDIGTLTGNLNQESNLNGTATFTARGFDPETMYLDGTFTLSQSQINEQEIRSARVEVDMNRGSMVFDAQMVLPEGEAHLVGTARPFAPTPRYEVADGTFRNINMAAFTGNPDMESSLNGTLSIQGTGFDPETMSVRGRINFAASRFNEQTINSALLSGELSGGTADIVLNLDVPDGQTRLNATVRPFLETPTYTIHDGTFSGINLAAFTGNPDMESNLSGTLAVEGSGFDPETMTIQGRINFAASRLNEQTINSAVLSGELSGGTANIELNLNVPEGETRLTATVRPFLETPTYTIHDGTFEGINIAALTGNPDWQTNLAGSISLSGRGFDPQTLSTEGTVTLRRSVVNDATIESGRIIGSVSQGDAQFDAELAFPDGSADVTGSVDLFAEVPDYQLQGTVTNLRLSDFIASDTLQAEISAQFDVEGRGTDPRTMELQGTIASGHAVYEGAVVDTLYSQFVMRDGVLRVDSLLLRSTAADATGGGVIALYDTATESDFEFVADIKDVRPIRELIPARQFNLAEGRVEGRVYGAGENLQFDVTGRFTNLLYNDIRLSEFEGTIAGEFGPERELSIAELDGSLEAISLPQLLIESANLQVQYQNGAMLFEGRVNVDPRRYADVAGRVDMRPEAQVITLDSLDLYLDGDEWQLLQEATITYGEAYRVSNLLLYSEDQQIAIDGVIDPAGTQNLVMTIEEFEMGTVADLLGYEGLGGVLSGTLLLTGPAEGPEMSGTLNADLTASGQDIGDLRLVLDYDSLRLNIDAQLTHEDGSSLLAEGYIPLDLRIQRLEEGGLGGDLADRSVNLTVTSDSFSVDWLDPFLDPEVISEFEGHLTGNVDISGSLDQPILDGRATMVDGAVGLAEFDVTYRDIRAVFEFDQNQVHVSDLHMTSGRGTVTGEGDINLAELTLGEFDINLRADEFLAVDSRSYTAVIDGLMHLAGTTRRPRLEGNLDLVSAEFYLNEETTGPELEQVELTQDDLQTIEQRFGFRVTEADTTTFNFYNALAMDLSLNIERNTWIRSRVNPVMDIQFSGRLDLAKPHYGDLQMYGTIDVVEQRSRIIQFGKRFNITSGTLTFNGPANDPYIDIGAEYDARSLRGRVQNDVTITLSIEGRMSEQLDLTLGSDPSMEYADIVSYIATGQPASEGLQLGGETLAAGTDLAFGQLTAMIEGVAGSRLGLDLVTIDVTGGAPTLTAGKYVRPRLFVAVSQPIGQTGDDTQTTTPFSENTPVVTVEYEIQNWLLLRLLGGSQALRLNLLFEYAY